jgi:hypothetical protein
MVKRSISWIASVVHAAVLGAALWGTLACGEPPPVEQQAIVVEEEERPLPRPCTEDAFEPNDTRPEAARIEPGTPVEGALCGEGDDFFAVDATAGCTLSAALTFDVEGGDVDLLLFGPEGQLVGASSTATEREDLEALTAVDGTFAFRLRGLLRGTATYTFDVERTCP